MGRPKEDEQLVNLCRRLIQQRAGQEQIDAAVKDIEAYIANNDEFRKQYVSILTRVLDLKYGNEIGQAAMRKQLEKGGKGDGRGASSRGRSGPPPTGGRGA